MIFFWKYEFIVLNQYMLGKSYFFCMIYIKNVLYKMIVWTAVNKCSVRRVLTSSSYQTEDVPLLTVAPPCLPLSLQLLQLYYILLMLFCMLSFAQFCKPPSSDDHGFFSPLLIKVRIDPLQGNTREAPSGNFQWQFSPTVLAHNDCMFV